MPSAPSFSSSDTGKSFTLDEAHKTSRQNSLNMSPPSYHDEDTKSGRSSRHTQEPEDQIPILSDEEKLLEERRLIEEKISSIRSWISNLPDPKETQTDDVSQPQIDAPSHPPSNPSETTPCIRRRDWRLIGDSVERRERIWKRDDYFPDPNRFRTDLEGSQHTPDHMVLSQKPWEVLKFARNRKLIDSGGCQPSEDAEDYLYDPYSHTVYQFRRPSGRPRVLQTGSLFHIEVTKGLGTDADIAITYKGPVDDRDSWPEDGKIPDLTKITHLVDNLPASSLQSAGSQTPIMSIDQLSAAVEKTIAELSLAPDSIQIAAQTSVVPCEEWGRGPSRWWDNLWVEVEDGEGSDAQV